MFMRWAAASSPRPDVGADPVGKVEQHIPRTTRATPPLSPTTSVTLATAPAWPRNLLSRTRWCWSRRSFWGVAFGADGPVFPLIVSAIGAIIAYWCSDPLVLPNRSGDRDQPGVLHLRRSVAALAAGGVALPAGQLGRCGGHLARGPGLADGSNDPVSPQLLAIGAVVIGVVLAADQAPTDTSPPPTAPADIGKTSAPGHGDPRRVSGLSPRSTRRW